MNFLVPRAFHQIVETPREREIHILQKRKVFFLEQQRPHAAHLALLLDEDLEVLVDDGDGQEDAGAGAHGADEVGRDAQRADAEAAERRGGGDVRVEHLHAAFVSTPTRHFQFD